MGPSGFGMCLRLKVKVLLGNEKALDSRNVSYQ